MSGMRLRGATCLVLSLLLVLLVVLIVLLFFVLVLFLLICWGAFNDITGLEILVKAWIWLTTASIICWYPMWWRVGEKKSGACCLKKSIYNVVCFTVVVEVIGGSDGVAGASGWGGLSDALDAGGSSTMGGSGVGSVVVVVVPGVVVVKTSYCVWISFCGPV